MLSILDFLATGSVTTYQIASQLVYPHLPDHSSAEWKASSERRQVQRLVDEATKLMNGGYRALLAKGYPGRQK